MHTTEFTKESIWLRFFSGGVFKIIKRNFDCGCPLRNNYSPKSVYIIHFIVCAVIIRVNSSRTVQLLRINLRAVLKLHGEYAVVLAGGFIASAVLLALQHREAAVLVVVVLFPCSAKCGNCFIGFEPCFVLNRNPRDIIIIGIKNIAIRKSFAGIKECICRNCCIRFKSNLCGITVVYHTRYGDIGHGKASDKLSACKVRCGSADNIAI